MDVYKRFLLGALFASVFVTACSDSDGILVTDSGGQGTLDSPSSGEHTPHTGPAEGVWPPQPADMENVEPFPASARAGVLTGVLSAARRSMLNNPQVRQSLGSDYREIQASLGDAKGSEVAVVVFYNYASDETIEVSLGRDGAVTIEISAASMYQPMEHPQEELDAIALASSALGNSSFDISGLKPTAMLAFPSKRSIQSVDQHFYNQRVLYVTFGPGGGELPVYTALVDLSNAIVLDHGLVK